MIYCTLRRSHFLLFLILSSGLSGCGGDTCQQLNSQIKDALVDGNITATETEELVAFVKDPENDFGKKCNQLRSANGQPDRAAMLAFIKQNPTYWKLTQKTGQPPVVEGIVAASEEPLRAKLYLEASASMFPYDDPNGQGQFKSAITDLLNPFENRQPGKTQLAVVNDKVYDLGMTYGSFIDQLNLYAPKLKKGNSGFTDFSLIFSQILVSLTEGDVAVLASDLIYSPIDKNASPAKIMNMGQDMMTNVFGPVAANTSLLVLQLTADYRGKYYSEKARKWVSASNVPSERPYYLCIMARNATMQRVLADPSRYDLQHLPGFKNFWLFSKATQQQAPTYTVLLNDATKQGSYRQGKQSLKTRSATIHELESVEADKINKSLTIPVAIDLSKLYLPEATKTNPGQYEVVTGPDGFRVSRIEAYGQTDGKAAGPQQTTHKLVLTSAKPARNSRTVTVGLRRTFPPRWVSNSHTTDDSQPDAQTTFGLQNLLAGIERAYNPTQQPTYFKLTIGLK